MTKFMLLAARRSGTTLLVDYLNGHPQIECVKRAFGLEKKVKNPTRDNHSGGFYLYRTRSLSHRIQYILRRDRLINDFLREDIFMPRQDVAAVGFRLIYEMSSRYPQITDWAKGNDARVIHIVRRNLLKTYISAVSAPIHKMRHPREGVIIKTTKIRVDPGKVLEILKQRIREIEHRRQQLSGCMYHELSYEDLVSNRDEALRNIQTFLGVDLEDVSRRQAD